MSVRCQLNAMPRKLVPGSAEMVSRQHRSFRVQTKNPRDFVSRICIQAVFPLGKTSKPGNRLILFPSNDPNDDPDRKDKQQRRKDASKDAC